MDERTWEQLAGIRGLPDNECGPELPVGATDQEVLMWAAAGFAVCSGEHCNHRDLGRLKQALGMETQADG